MGRVKQSKRRFFIYPLGDKTTMMICEHLANQGRPVTEAELTDYRDKKGAISLIEIYEADVEYLKSMKADCDLRYRKFVQNHGEEIKEVRCFDPERASRYTDKNGQRRQQSWTDTRDTVRKMLDHQ